MDLSKYVSDVEVFKDESVLSERYTPESMPERDEEMKEISFHLSGAQKENRDAANLMIHGKTGQGKTACVRLLLDSLHTIVDPEKFEIIFQSCADCSGSYEVACKITEQLTGTNPNGHTQSQVFSKMYEAMDGRAEYTFIVLDEIDAIGSKDDIIYNIPRAVSDGHLTETDPYIIGISNNSSFLSGLDPRALSSFKPRSINFDCYDAGQLTSILKRRADKAFLDGAIEESAIKLCAALAARDQGNARQALDYLNGAGKIALDNNEEVITEEHVRRSEEKIEKESTANSIKGLTRQDHLSLSAVVLAEKEENTPIRTREIYSKYTHLASKTGDKTIGYNRVRKHLQELDMIGVLEGNKKVGELQGGPKYYWSLQSDLQTTIDALDDATDLEETLKSI